MTDMLEFFAACRALFYLVGLLVMFAFLALAAAGAPAGARAEPRSVWMRHALLASAALAIVVWRWPMLLWPNPLNIDEGYFTAGALKATVDFAPWRGFDTATSGPLNAYVLALPALVGAQIDMFSTRVIGLALVIGTVAAFYHAVRLALGVRVAAAAAIAPVIFFTVTTDPEFIHASTEHLPIFLTTAALAAAAYLGAELVAPRRKTAAAVAGFCIGAAAFAKLQVLPIAGMVFLLAVAAVFFTRNGEQSRPWAELGFLAGGAGIVPGVMVISVLAFGSWNDAVISYLGSSLAFIERGKPVGWAFFFRNSPWYTVFAAASLLALTAGAAAAAMTRQASARASAVSAAALLLLLAALFAIYQPHRPWRHYLLFSIVPLSCCVAAALRLTIDAGWWKGRDAWMIGSCIVLFVLPPLSVAMAIPHPFLDPRPRVVAQPQIDAIARHAPPGSRLAVWGWMPHYYVETATIPATREAETIRQIEPGPYRDFFRQRFLSDLRASMPIAFVDAVAPGTWFFNDRATQAIESFPELHTFISTHYELKEEVEGVRVFVRKRS